MLNYFSFDKNSHLCVRFMKIYISKINKLNIKIPGFVNISGDTSRTEIEPGCRE